MNVLQKFLDHPHSVGETYSQHLEYALIGVFKLAFFSLALGVHAIFPFWFENTAGDGIIKFADEIEERRKNLVQF